MTPHATTRDDGPPPVHGLLWGSDLEHRTQAFNALRQAVGATYRLIAVNTVLGRTDPFTDADYQAPRVIDSHRGAGYSWIALASAGEPPPTRRPIAAPDASSDAGAGGAGPSRGRS